MAAFGLSGWAVCSARGSMRYVTTVDPPPAERPAHLGSEGDRLVGQGEERCDGALDLTFPLDGCVRFPRGGPCAPRAAQRVIPTSPEVSDFASVDPPGRRATRPPAGPTV
jgi:hypothetical protein